MEKNDEKLTKLHVYETGTNGLKILDCLYSYQKPLKISDIVEDTGLEKKQVYRSVSFLHAIGSITKKFGEKNKAKRRIPPTRTLFVSLSEKQIKNAYRVLNKNGRVQNTSK